MNYANKSYLTYTISFVKDGVLYYGTVYEEGRRVKRNIKSPTLGGCLGKCKTWIDEDVVDMNTPTTLTDEQISNKIQEKFKNKLGY